MKFNALKLGLICCPILAGCDSEMSQAERDARDAEIVERVKEANDLAPPLFDIVPQAILHPDIEANDLFGKSCAYAPGTSLGARVIARETDAYMKIDGEMVRFAADPGSRELPAGSRTLYNGREYSLRLEIEGDDADKDESVGTDLFEGTVWLRDRWDRVVYQGSGAVSCGR